MNPCRNGGVCSARDATFACNCAATGYEGERCDLPVAKCMGCDAQATCTTLQGMPLCTCAAPLAKPAAQVADSERAAQPPNLSQFWRAIKLNFTTKQ